MIATATIRGIFVEVTGTPDECVRFIRKFSGVDKVEEKVCDPMARHYGNCGAKDCPVIGPLTEWRFL